MDIPDRRRWSWERPNQPSRPLQPIHNNNQTQPRNSRGGSAPREVLQNRPSVTLDVLSIPCTCGVKEPPLVRCCDCEANLCASCSYEHKRVKRTRDDVLVPLTDDLSDTAWAKILLYDGYKENRVCGPHDPSKSPLYCETCSEGVCTVCYPVEHLVHEVVTIRDALERAKITANMLKAEASSGLQKMNALIEETNRNMRSIDTSSREIEREIRNSMSELRRLINFREKGLLWALKAATKGQSDALLDDLNTFSKLQSANQRVHQAITDATETTPSDFMRIRGLCEQDMKLTKERERKAVIRDVDVVFDAPDPSLLLKVAVSGKVMTIERHPFNGTIGSELKRCRSNSPQQQNKKPALDYSSLDSHQEDSPGARSMPMWNPWNNLNDVDLTPLLADVPYVAKTPISNNSSSNSEWHLMNSQVSMRPEAAVSAGHLPHRPSDVSQQQQHSRELQAPRVVSNYVEAGRPKMIIGKEGADDGDLCRPWGICCDREGNFIIADRSNHRIQIFSPEGVFKFNFGSFGKQEPGTFDRPAGVAVDHTGRIIVVDKDNHRVQIFNCKGYFLFMFGSEGTRNGQFHYPWDVAVNSAGAMAISDTRNHRVQLFSRDGTFLRKFGVVNVGCCKHFDSPRGLCFMSDGGVLVSDFNNHRLVIIDAEFQTARVMGTEGGLPKQFMRPQGVAVDAEGNIIVADSRNNRIQIFKEDGTYICQFGSAGREPGQFDRPCGICFTPDGKIAVVDFGNNRVQVF